MLPTIFGLILRYYHWVERCICWTTSKVAAGSAQSQKTSSPFTGSLVLPGDGCPCFRRGMYRCLPVRSCTPWWKVLFRKLYLLWKRRAEGIVWALNLHVEEVRLFKTHWQIELLFCTSSKNVLPVIIDSMLFPFYRCLLHCNFVVLVESHRHHSGELPSPLCPEVPETKVFSAKLFEAHILGLLSLHTRDKHCTWLRDKIM